MKTQKTFLRYFIEFIVILSGVSASFWVEEYRESLQNEEEMYKVLNNLKIELDEIDVYSKEREIVFNKDSDIIRLLTNNQSNSLDSIFLLVETTFEIEVIGLLIIEVSGHQWIDIILLLMRGSKICKV